VVGVAAALLLLALASRAAEAADRAIMDNPSKARLRVFKALGNIDCTYLVG